MKKSTVMLALFLLVCLPIASQQSAPQQETSAPAPPAKRPNIPSTFTNLIVLPKTISKPNLMNIMKQFSVTMKMRCSSCHAVSDDLSEGSFASDEKPAKADARKLVVFLQQTAPPAKP